MKHFRKHILMVTSVVVLWVGQSFAAQPAVDADLQAYQKAEGISGSLNSIGSDTMNNLLKLWGEAFRAMYPGHAKLLAVKERVDPERRFWSEAAQRLFG